MKIIKSINDETGYIIVKIEMTEEEKSIFKGMRLNYCDDKGHSVYGLFPTHIKCSVNLIELAYVWYAGEKYDLLIIDERITPTEILKHCISKLEEIRDFKLGMQSRCGEAECLSITDVAKALYPTNQLFYKTKSGEMKALE